MDKIKHRIESLRDEVDQKVELIKLLETKLTKQVFKRNGLNDIRKSLEAKLEKAENALDFTEVQLKGIMDLLEAATLETEERDLRNTDNLVNSNLDDRNENLDTMKCAADETDRKYEEVARQLVMMDAGLEKAEDRIDKAEAENMLLKKEITELTNLIRSYSVMECTMEANHNQTTQKIKELTGQLKSSTNRRETVEKKLQGVISICAKVDDKLESAEIQKHNAREGLNVLLIELGKISY